MEEIMKKAGGSSYLEYYNSAISPRLKEIDVTLRCGGRITTEKAGRLLDLSRAEIENISGKSKLISPKDFIYIMGKGSSPICKMYKREIELGSPFLYTPEDIAYIYGLDLDMLKKVCRHFKIIKITWQTLPVIFSHMPAA